MGSVYVPKAVLTDKNFEKSTQMKSEELFIRLEGYTVHRKLVAFLCLFYTVYYKIAHLPAPTWLDSSAGFTSLHLSPPHRPPAVALGRNARRLGFTNRSLCGGESHCTCNHKVMGSNPVQAWIFQAFLATIVDMNGNSNKLHVNRRHIRYYC